MKEIWELINDTEGKYLISNFGGLKTTSRNVKNRHNQKRFVSGIARKTTPRKDGYHLAAFYLNGKRWSRYVHHLVWQYFGDGRKSNHKLTLDHIDNNKSNNRIDNLQLISHRENTNKGMLRKSVRLNSKYVGVYWRASRGHWYARIQDNGERFYLGSYKTEFEAHLAYQKALKQLYFLQKIAL